MWPLEDIKEFVCVDSSKEILSKAREKLGKCPGFSFTPYLESVEGKFDVITISSVFHHVVHPEKLAQKVDTLLDIGGIIMGSHEPNKRPFRRGTFRAGASFYKRIGGAIGFDEVLVKELNNRLRRKYPNSPSVCREEILQMVEYHSPVEQYDRDIDSKTGFIPEEFIGSCFPGYEVLTLDTYTTFFQRPWLSKHRRTQSLLGALFKMFFKEGNLFRFVLRKPSKQRIRDTES